MTRKFQVREGAPPDESFFDRQKMISWWDQETIAAAKIMVVGAGALGNETIKNLLLLGFRNLLICDFDTIETSNLSRTVLFGPADIGRRKAEVAAERAKKLALSPESRIAAFHGDITSDLGLGVFQEMDIVLGCLDNVEARRFVNRACRLVGRPWIDSGINELAGHVSFYSPTSDVCYECVLSDHQLTLARQRYSCDNVKRLHVQQARTPTVQVTSSIVSGILVQECVKHLCSNAAVAGQRLWFNGANNQFEIFTLRPRQDCEMHVAFDRVVDVDLSTGATLRQALATLAAAGFGAQPTIDTLGLRPFVTVAACRKCGRAIELYRPQHGLSEADLVCDAVHPEGDEDQAAGAETPVAKQVIGSFAGDSEPRILDMTLAELGIAPADIVGVGDGTEVRYVRLAGDLERVLASV